MKENIKKRRKTYPIKSDRAIPAITQ